MSFTLSTSNLTDTSVSIVMTLTSDYSTSQSVSMSVQEGGSSGSTIYSTTVTIPDGATTGDRIHTPVSSLTASTTYYVATTISGGVIAADLTFTTRDTGYDTVPKVATQGQWEDLADKVQSKAEIGSVLSTPSDVAYVGTNNIADGAVTADKIDFATFPIPQSTGSEMDTGLKYNNAPIYAQRFAGSESISANVTKNVTLISSGIYRAIKAIGWLKIGANLSSSIIGSVFVTNGTSSPAINGGHIIMVNASNQLILRAIYTTAQTMTYDVVVYYIKL